MRGLTFLAILFAACNGGSSATDTATDTRMPLSVEYVRGATLKIHAKPADAAPVITTYQHGESVSVLSQHGSWAEVRTGSSSGWVHASELANAAEATQAEADNVKPHFTHTPEPVTQPGARGELDFEADVNTDGVVTSVRTIRNTTGSQSLEQRNIASLQRAVFTPVVRHGKREPFVYEHRVHY
jgi:uncharacterized protein YgiM (DUF1202 family)